MACPCPPWHERREGLWEAKALKAFLIAAVLLVVLAIGTGLVLNAEFAEASSDRYQAAGSVRLDPSQRSFEPAPEGGAATDYGVQAEAN